MPCGPDPEPVLEQVKEMIDAGVDHVYFHQIGPDQEGFCTFWDERAAPGAHGGTATLRAPRSLATVKRTGPSNVSPSTASRTGPSSEWISTDSQRRSA